MFDANSLFQYMSSDSEAASAFTSTILKNVREQRHKAVRVVIATQEPSINPALLDLCTITIVHRFTSPAWYAEIRKHLAGALFAEKATGEPADDVEEEDNGRVKRANDFGLMREIVRLKVGESLLFCPTAALSVTENGSVRKLDEGYVKFKTRPRLTTDGGTARMAN
jgi:hypothetical protein